MRRKKLNRVSKNGFRILLKYLFEYKSEIVIISILGVISGLANAAVPYIVGSFFDAILNISAEFSRFGKTIPLWAMFIGLFAITQIIANLVDWVINRKSKKIGTLAQAEYISASATHLLNLPMSFHKENKTGEVWDKIVRASNSLDSLLGNVIIGLAPQIFSVVVGLLIAVYINPLLALILVAGIVLYIITLFIIVPPIVTLQRKGYTLWNKAFGHAYDAVMNFQTIKQSVAELYEEKKIRSKFVSGVSMWLKVENIWSAVDFYQRMIVLITQISIFAISAHLVQNGTLTIGELIALNGYAMMVFGPFVILGKYWQTIQNGIIVLERTEKILQMSTEKYDSAKSEKLEKIKGNVEFQNVFFSYKKSEPTILKDINFEIKAGDVVALVGESGVGKSTAMELVSGYYFPTKGKVLIDGHDTKKSSLRALREHIAIVPQEPVLFNDTVRQNIKYGKFNATEKEIMSAAQKAHADVFIDKFPKKYNQIVGERGIRLSVGQKQRIAIARAILRDPEILILDEPTSALDAKTEKFITESLEELMRGRTTFIIAHRLSTSRKADKILVFKDGKIVESGKHEELLKIKNGVYKHLYEYQIGLK